MNIFLISHTHWDREWYLPFQQFRLRLVHLLDNLLELLAQQPDYRHFMLDGQTIILDDYLDLRPERESELRQLIQDGRLLIGPWHILPDEFLVSPEATIRNLLQGERTAMRFGKKMAVGYIPDPFGHIGQMPQIMEGFGITSACVQRGLSNEPVELWWEAPDGSRVFLAYLRDGYGNASGLPAENNEFFTTEVLRLAASLLPHTAASSAGRSDEACLLFMQGTDHMEPVPETPAALEFASRRLGKEQIAHTTLPEYIEAAQAFITENNLQIPSITGELRSSQRHHLLPGVLSTRMWIKQRNQACENLLEKWAEPFSVWATLAHPLPPGPSLAPVAPLHALRIASPEGILQRAWRLLMECHPHDSICGCSVDQVHAEMRPRFDQVEQLAEALTIQSLEALAEGADTQPPSSWDTDKNPPFAAVVVFNPLAWTRTDWAAVSVQLPPGIDRLEVVDQGGFSLPHHSIGGSSQEIPIITLDRHGLQSLLENVRYGRLGSMGFRQVEFRVEEEQLHINAVFAEGREPDPVAWEQALHQMQSYLDDYGFNNFTVSAHSLTDTLVVFTAADIPACGYRTFWLRAAANQESETERVRLSPLAGQVLPLAAKLASSQGVHLTEREVSAGRKQLREKSHLANEFLELSFSAKDGAFSVVDKRNGAVYTDLNRFMDGGDCGDEYNYCPPPSDRMVSKADVKAVHVSDGPVQKSIEVELVLRIPEALESSRKGRSAERINLPITTVATLISGVPRVDFHTVVDNRAQDHRLRVHFPAPFAALQGEHDGHFEIVRRGIGLLSFDESWAEHPRPEVPQRAFTRIESSPLSMVVANRGLPEVEVLENETGQAEIALTLLRSVGWLSRDDFPNRKGHAGPMLATPGAQEIGLHAFDYAFIPGSSSEVMADYQQAYAFGSPLRAAATSLHPGILARQASMFQVSEPAFVISAIKAADSGDGGLVLRGYNLDSRTLDVSIRPWQPFSRVERVSLSEQNPAALNIGEDGMVTLPVEGHQIVTLKFSGSLPRPGTDEID